MNKCKKSVTVVVVLAMCCMMCFSVAAARATIMLPPNQNWSVGKTDTRTGNYGYVSVGCDSVYPVSGTDNFQYIQARILNESGNLIMDDSYTIIKEGTGLQSIDIKQGYLNTKIVTFQFRGNTSSNAVAEVTYYAN